MDFFYKSHAGGLADLLVQAQKNVHYVNFFRTFSADGRKTGFFVFFSMKVPGKGPKSL